MAIALVDFAAALDVRAVVGQDFAKRHEEDVLTHATLLGDLQHVAADEIVHATGQIAKLLAQPDEGAQAVELAAKGAASPERQPAQGLGAGTLVGRARIGPHGSR